MRILIWDPEKQTQIVSIFNNSNFIKKIEEINSTFAYSEANDFTNNSIINDTAQFEETSLGMIPLIFEKDSVF